MVGATLLGILQDKTFHYGAGATPNQPFYPRTEGIQPRFLPPFNTTLTKIIIGLIKCISAALPLRNFAIKIEFALILCLIKTLFAEFVFISGWLIVNLTLPFPSWQTDRGCCFTSQPILGRTLDSGVPQGKQKPYVKGTSATQKQSVPSASDIKLLPFVCWVVVCFFFFPSFPDTEKNQV